MFNNKLTQYKADIRKAYFNYWRNFVREEAENNLADVESSLVSIDHTELLGLDQESPR